MIHRFLASAGAIGLAGVVSACTAPNMPPYPLPDEPGLYAILSDDELLRLDGDEEDEDWVEDTWPERSALDRYTEFVIYEPGLSPATQTERPLVDIWRVAWLRSEVDASGYAGPVEDTEWVVAPLDRFHELAAVEFVEGWPGYVHVAPKRPLKVGLYALHLNREADDRVAHFGVEWTSVDEGLYAARNCVDRYVGSEPRYRNCSGGTEPPQEAATATDTDTDTDTATITATDSAADTATDTEGLEVTLVDPQRHDTTLVVQGAVTNTTDSPKRLPGMQAVLVDRSGRKLSQASIELSKSELSAGERMRFRTEIANAPAEAARINVEFVPATNAGM